MATIPPATGLASDPVRGPRRPRPGDEPPVFPGGRDRSLPISALDLNRVLLAQPELTPHEQAAFRQFQKRLSAVFHHEFHAWLNELKELYAPIDPDELDERRRPWRDLPHERADEEFLKSYEATLIKGNYQKLEFRHIVDAVTARNGLGLDYMPNFELFEHLNVYVRGRCQIQRKVRNLTTLYRSQDRVYEAYRRVVIVLKFKPGAPLDEYMRDDVVYLRMFRDVPFAEMDMHLPEQGTRVKMRWVDKAQIASPLFTGPATIVAKVLFGGLLLRFSPMALATILAVPLGAGLKSFFGFRQTRTRHLHFMIRHLYYLTQANNSSVLSRLIDTAEEEEYKETLLAYYLLWQHAADAPIPWDQAVLDREVERFLRDRAGIDTDFEIGDALRKLRRLGLLDDDPEGYSRVVPIDQALKVLDDLWSDAHRIREDDPPTMA